MDYFLILSFLITVSSVNRQCKEKRFGPSCTFQCHCHYSRCDDKTGECPRKICKAGYFGPSCQYENIAYNKPSRWGKKGYSPKKAVDGSEGSCSFSSRNPADFWTVDIGDTTWINTITIRRHPNGTKNMMVYVSNSSERTGDDFILCNDTSWWSDDETFHTRCSSAILGQHVFVLGDVNETTFLGLCEVYVSGGRNIAFAKNASQSSNYLNSYNASLAVDGNTNTNFDDKSCSHTDDTICSPRPSWKVKLGKDYLIKRIVVYNRNTHSKRLHKFYIMGAKKGGNWTHLYKNNDTNPPEVISVTLTTPSVINRVKIELNGTCRLLTLCEVQVYGDCLDGHYGLDCNNRCQCQDNSEVCGKLDGRCLSGCTAGKTGISCNTDCTKGKFGKNCIHQCNVTCKDKMCDIRTGQCNSGCIAGYQGEFCGEECDDVHFGENCSRRCSDHCKKGSCNKDDGTCPHGCKTGWLPYNCTKACSHGHFGERCEELCSSTCVNSSCKNTDGGCINGCLPGWRGLHCSEHCTSGTYGDGCSKKCQTTCRNNECNRINGSCSQGCEIGWSGDVCHKACPNTKYGQGCLSTCHDNCVDNLCHTQTGACLRCTDGWKGPMCQTASKSVNITAVVVPAIIVFVVMIITVTVSIAVLMHRRKLNTRRAKSSDQCVYQNPTTAAELPRVTDNGHTLKNTQGVICLDENEDVNIVDIEEKADAQADVDMNTVTQRSGKVDEQNDDNVYYNAPALQVNTAIALTTLTSLMGWWREDEHYFLQEFKKLPRDLQFPCTVAQSDGNKGKNRYKNICAYDHSRVILSILPGKPNSNYINACFIDGFNKKKAFIAAQGPTLYILNDFVRMIWEMNITVIVLLANIMEEGKDNTTPRCVEVFHYTSWPDKDVPDSPVALLHFRDRVKQETTTAPILVHCSAGIGRTGTFIALDYLLDEASSTEQIDVYQCIFKLRQQRVNMVQTLNQYTLIHEAVTMTLLLQNSIASVNFKLEEVLSNIVQEYENVDILSVNQNHEFMDGMTKENSSKNRDKSVLPSNKYRPKLWIPVEGCNDYINAVYVKSYTDRKGYVQTQSPLPNTTVDFWRLVVEDSIAVIICLDTYKYDKKNAPVYWPNVHASKQCGPFRIKCISEEKQGITTERKLVVENEEYHVDIEHFCYKDWPKDSSVPTSTSQFVSFIQRVQTARHKPILVHCRSGYIHSGLFCAVSNMLDHLKHEHEIGVGNVVMQIRESRFQNVFSLDQYIFCYKCASEKIDNEPVYSNM